MRSAGAQRKSEHPDFPSEVYGYVAFRRPDAEPERLGRRIYSTPFETDRHRLATRVERTLTGNDRAEPTFIVAKFQLVTVEAIRIGGRP